MFKRCAHSQAHFYPERLQGFQDEDSPVRRTCYLHSVPPDWAGAFAAKRIRVGSCNCACQCVHSPRGDSPKRSLHLRRIRRLWLNSFGGGLNRNPTPGVGRHVLNSSTTAACRICSTFWAFQNHRSLRYRTQGVIMLSRARYSWVLAGLELPCDAGRLQCRSSTKRSERRGGIASGPEVDASFLLSLIHI